jgi:hypothetical protein
MEKALWLTEPLFYLVFGGNAAGMHDLPINDNTWC